MKTIHKLLPLLIGIALVFSELSFAQPRPGMGMGPGAKGGWGANGQYMRLYNTSTEQTVTGTVTEINYVTPMKNMRSKGVRLTLNTESGVISVHLGPMWYINNQDTKIEKNDKLTIFGSKITFNDKPAIIASKVTKGDHVLTLRDANGFPAWAGWRMRQPMNK